MSKNIISQIDEQLEFLHHCRAVFPYLPEEFEGELRFKTAPYYQNLGFKYIFEFSSPLTLKFITDFNYISHWINQNFVVRLYAVLESNKLISPSTKIRSDLEGHEEVDIVRRLRNIFGHSSGNYDPKESEQKKLFYRIQNHFNLSKDEMSKLKGKFPLPIDQILRPLAEGCKRYAVANKRDRSERTR